jgi:hypothetical protein
MNLIGKARAVVLASLCLIAVACGSAKDPAPVAPPPETPVAKLSIGVSAKAVRAGAGAVMLNARLENSTDVVKWSLTGAGSLDALEGLVTTYMPPASCTVRTAVEVKAVAGPLTATETLDVICEAPAGPEFVVGKVVDEDYNGIPFWPVVVLDNDGNEVGNAHTDEQGVFSIGGVTPPFDVVVKVYDTVFVFEHLTETGDAMAPLQFFIWKIDDEQLGNYDRYATVEVNLHGGWPFEQLGAAILGFNSPEVHSWYNPDRVDFDGGWDQCLSANYDLDIEWNGGSSTTGTLLGLEFLGSPQCEPICNVEARLAGRCCFMYPNVAPTQYWLAVKNGVEVFDVQTLCNQTGTCAHPTDVVTKEDLYMQPVASETISGEVSTPPGYWLTSKFLGLTFGAFDEPQGPYAFGLFLDKIVGDRGGWGEQQHFFYEAPDVPFAAAQVCAHAESERPTGWTKSVTCNSALDDSYTTVAINAAPEPLAVENGSYATKFQWTPYAEAEGIYVTTFKPTSNGGIKYVIVTDCEETSIPVLTNPASSLGLDPIDGTYSWNVRFIGPFDSVDDFVGRPWVSVPPFDRILPPNSLGGDVAYWARSARTYVAF